MIGDECMPLHFLGTHNKHYVKFEHLDNLICSTLVGECWFISGFSCMGGMVVLLSAVQLLHTVVHNMLDKPCAM